MQTLFRPAVNDQTISKCMTENDTRPISPGMEELFQTLRRLEAFTSRCATKVKDHIDKNPLQQKSTDYFAELTGIDRKVLQKVFKEKYQITISAYQLQKRMEAAANLLQEDRLAHKQIACRCGYHNVNNFSRAFKKVFKHSPRQFLYLLSQQPLDSEDIKKD
jgi:AraC-like DNA-binding protein